MPRDHGDVVPRGRVSRCAGTAPGRPRSSGNSESQAVEDRQGEKEKDTPQSRKGNALGLRVALPGSAPEA
eukprot:807403-Pyramimonas_sp.AAC.1